MIVIVVTLVLAPEAWAASKYKILYKFKFGMDGNAPASGLVLDAAGNLYGTTYTGGNRCWVISTCGVVFKLAPHSDGRWTESVVYAFTGTDGDGFWPDAEDGLTLDAAGNLYGTTLAGGTDACGGDWGCGTVFKLTPNPDRGWTESVLYRFTGGTDGFDPQGGLILDAAGNLYGTTYAGGGGGLDACEDGWACGTVFKLTPNPDGGWAQSVLYSFTGGTDRGSPKGSLIFDAAGNLYGTTTYGGGTVFKLTSSADGGWSESVLHSFGNTNGDGLNPQVALIFDGAGNLYGTTNNGGPYGGGTVFQLAPNPDGTWKEKVLHKFGGRKDGALPQASLIFDAIGNLYGTTRGGGAHGWGTVFELVPKSSGGWHETVLHAFLNGPGSNPQGGLIFDAAGNVFGTTSGDATRTSSSVFEITP